MKAILIEQFGSPDVLTYTDVAEPQLNPGEVLVKNRAAGVNPIDWKTCSGGGAAPFLGELPYIPGWEFAGTIEKIADDVENFAVGDEVFGFIKFPQQAGCFAEYIAAPTEQICLRPDELPVEQAAALSAAGLTAWQALFEIAQLKPDHQVLILAAAGGVGHLVVQLAKWIGARVIATASESNHDFLLQLGADQVIDYRTQKVPEQVNNVDLMIDCVGGIAGIEALRCVKPGGLVVTLPSVTKEEVIAAGQQMKVNVEPILALPNSEILQQLAGLCADRKLAVEIADSFPLSQLEKAFTQSMAGHTRGKLVVTL
jgi:NADPH2:quinone reductase